MLEALDIDRSAYWPWLPWTRADNQNLAQCIYVIERMRRDRERINPPADDFTLGIFDRATGAVLGGTGLHRIHHPSHQAEIGYWMRPDRRRQGLTTEAVAGLISWAFTPTTRGGWGLRRIEILCAAANAASQAVPMKLGLRREIHLRAHRWVEGIGWNDTLGWGVLAEEWDAERRRLRPGSA